MWFILGLLFGFVGAIIAGVVRAITPPPIPPPTLPPRPEIGGFDAHPRHICRNDLVILQWHGVRAGSQRVAGAAWVAEPTNHPTGVTVRELPRPVVDHGTDDPFRMDASGPFTITLFARNASGEARSTPVPMEAHGPNDPVTLSSQTAFYQTEGGPEVEGWTVQRIYSADPGENPNDWSRSLKVSRVEYEEGGDQDITVHKDGMRFTLSPPSSIGRSLTPRSTSFTPSGDLPLVGSWSLRIPPRPGDPTPSPPAMSVKIWVRCA